MTTSYSRCPANGGMVNGALGPGGGVLDHRIGGELGDVERAEGINGHVVGLADPGHPRR